MMVGSLCACHVGACHCEQLFTVTGTSGDEYGGSLENRAKFPLACIRAIRENIPEGMPLFMRIDAHDSVHENRCAR